MDEKKNIKERRKENKERKKGKKEREKSEREKPDRAGHWPAVTFSQLSSRVYI
jgi:hypothetical protein